MSGEEFERYCERLLPGLGYRNIKWIGGSGDGGADILATGKDNRDVAVQCKRRKRSIGPWAIREIAGTVAGGRHARRQPVLMTNARVTPRGWEAAEERNVRVIARDQLGHAMWQVRNKAFQPESVPEGQAGNTGLDASQPGSLQRVPPETTAIFGIVFCAAVTVLVVVIHALVASPRHGVATARAATATPVAASATPAAHISRPALQSEPVQVIRDYYAAISSHDWPLVWQLGGRNLGWGPYATYQGMISGYQDTIRDVLTEVHATGNTVTGRFLAYQTGGVIRPYQFTLVVRGGVIVSGHQQ